MIVARALTSALLLVVAVCGGVMLVAPGVLRDPPGYAGNALGTYLVMLVVALPVTALAMRAAARGSLAARFVWLGGVGYLLYNAILTSFSLQFNELFLFYVASLSLAVWSLVAVLRTVDAQTLPARFPARFPVRLVGGYLIATALAFGALWLTDVVPAALSGARPLSLRGTTLPVNVVHVIDFAFTLPVSLAAGVWLWRRRPWGFLLSGLMLVLLLIESVSIAVDQFVGHRNDPTQPVGTVALFVVLTVIGAVPTFAFLCSIGVPAGEERGPSVSRG
jgi:membrane protease YdiL (CAAX protease family)